MAISKGSKNKKSIGHAPTALAVKDESYSATIKVMGKTYKATGATALEALSSFDLSKVNLKGKSILIIEKGDKRKEKVLMPTVTYRLFNSHGLTKEIALKQISILFQGI